MTLKLCVLVPAHWEALMGGSEYQAKVLIEFLLKHHDVDVHYLTAYHKPDFRPDGYRIVRFSDRRGIRRYGSFFDVFRLYRALRDLAPDAILQLVGCAHTGIAAYYAKRNGCKMIWRVTNDRSLTPETAPWWRFHYYVERWFLNYGIRNADTILAQTELQRRLLAERFDRPDSILVSNFHPTPPDRVPPIQGEQRVLWIGNLNRQKNPAAFVRLAARFADRPNVRFTMIGGGHGDPWAQAQVQLIESAPNVEYLGRRSQEEVNARLEGAALLVSTSAHEGFSNTFIQAWLRRVPVASLNVDPDGLLAKAGLGTLAAGSEEQLYRDVERMLALPSAERAALGARCRAYAVANHSESNIAAIARLLGTPTMRAPQTAS
jgi:glycosyltransferase involved in cell wall biosynthesis